MNITIDNFGKKQVTMKKFFAEKKLNTQLKVLNHAAKQALVF